MGYEASRPQTSAVCIGDDCWIGENVAIFKGSTIWDRCIVGYGTLITGKTIPEDSRVVNQRVLMIDKLK